jgi:hypothetical protein
MRNILEATKTYSIGKTNSFSGRSAPYRHLKPCNFLIGCSSSSFSVVILPSLFFANMPKSEAISSKARNFPFSDELIQPFYSNLTANHNSYYHTFSVNISASINKLYSDAHWAYCSNIKKPNKVDCIITPVGILKQFDVSVNQAKICTLGEVAAVPDFPFETKILQHADGKKPKSGA